MIGTHKMEQNIKLISLFECLIKIGLESAVGIRFGFLGNWSFLIDGNFVIVFLHEDLAFLVYLGLKRIYLLKLLNLFVHKLLDLLAFYFHPVYLMVVVLLFRSDFISQLSLDLLLMFFDVLQFQFLLLCLFSQFFSHLSFNSLLLFVDNILIASVYGSMIDEQLL